ncbi:MAG: glycosyltransferase [bacterium]
MKILFVSYHNPNFVTITEYAEKAIKDLGHTLISFDDRKFVFPGRLRNRLGFLQRFDLNNLNKRLVKTVCESMPDLLLVTGGHRIFTDTVEKIKNKGIKTALWTIDPPHNFQSIIKSAPYYDHIFCGGSEAMELLNKAGIKKTHWLPFACDSQLHKPVKLTHEEKQKYGSDIAFIGSYYPNRGEILSRLTDFNLAIWGPGWDRLSSNHPLRKHINCGQIKPDDWLKIYCASKIAVIIHYQDGKVPCYQASPKVYETLACKCFALVDNQKDVKTLFKDGKHLVIFKDTDDLKDKIKYYLEHPEEREKIAEEGHKEVIKKHTYVHRIKNLVDIIGEREDE